MSKLRFALCILGLPFAFFSVQAQGTPQSAEIKPGTATVSGRVMWKGEPASGVMVVLIGRNSIPSNSSARTDESGRFRFTGVAAGRYSVSALAPGYASPNDTSRSLLGKALNVAEGEKVDNVDFEIKHGGVISGRITDWRGRPVVEETITLSKRDRNNQPENYFTYNPNNNMNRTDDRGVYRIYGLPEGRYLVSVGYAPQPGVVVITSSRSIYPRVFYPNANSESEAKAIEVSEGSEVADIDITVSDPKETRDISGRVVDAGTGQPVANMEVFVQGISSDDKDRDVRGGSRLQAGSDGAFRMSGVKPGKYRLFVRPADGYVSDELIIEISDDDATGIELKVRKGDASISGFVAIEGANDPRVLAILSEVNVGATTDFADLSKPGTVGTDPVKVNADGSFRITGVQAGRARIWTRQPPVTREIPVARVEHNGSPVREGIEINAGEQVTGVRVVLFYGKLTLRGAIKVVGGVMPAGYGFHAMARRTDQNAHYSSFALIDERGQFVFENVAPGEYEIEIFPFTQDALSFSPEIRERFSSVKHKVVVGSGNQQPVTLVVDLSRKEGDR